MLTLLGLFLAVIDSLCASAFNIINQQFKVDPPVLAIYNGLGVALILMPFLIFIPYPTSPMFYFLTILNGFVASYAYTKGFGVINKYGAGITSKLLTIPPVLVAISWWVINPSTFSNLVNNTPYKAAGAILCLAGMLFTIFALGKIRATKEALISSIPLFICYPILAIVCFYSLKEVSIIQAMFYYGFLQCLIMGIVNYFVHIHHLKGHVKKDLLLTLFDKKIMKAGLLFVLAVAGSRFACSAAFKLVPNPAYVNLITNLQIIWIYIASQFLHVKHTISPRKGIILAIYAITFIILTY